MKKPTPVEDILDMAGSGFDDPSWLEQWPTLFHYLSDVKWDDGASRETATLLLCFDAGRLKGCLNDRAMGRSAWFTGLSLVGLLNIIEKALREDTAEWRVAKVYGKGRR